MFNFRKKLLLFVLFFVLSGFWGLNFSNAQNSSDAISIRVIPNPNHYSSLRWYQEQGFVGAPQQLIVDGYEAVRNGNTVYVNAANVTDSAPQTLYTNIYMISFNTEADKDTEDIFARILENWKFNTNISLATGFCSPDFSSTVCLTNEDCPAGEYCTSDKAETIRDTARLASIAEFNTLLNEYMQKNGRYPTLSAGTYLPNKTVSTWPSWKNLLTRELGASLFLDPINDLGDCVGYNEDTCWDEEDKEFADADTSNDNIDLPAGSRAFVYEAAADGSEFDICSEMESGFVDSGSGDCASGSASTPPTSSQTTSSQTNSVTNQVSSVNHPPRIIGSNIPVAFSGNSYTAYIQAVDPDGDNINWTIDTSMTDWSSWTDIPSLSFGTSNNRVEIVSTGVGSIGSYDFTITVDDSNGGVSFRDFSIQVDNFPPIINSTPLTLTATTSPFSGSFIVRGDTNNYPLTCTVGGGDLPDNLSTGCSPNGSYFDFEVSGTLDPSSGDIFNDGVTPVVRPLTVSDLYGTSNTGELRLNIINNKPIVSGHSACNVVERSSISSFTPPVSATVPGINDLTVSPNPWVVDNINSGGTATIDITVNTSNADDCSWCGLPVSCNGTTQITTNGYQENSVVSCLLWARDTSSGQSVSRRGYSTYTCSGEHQSTGTYHGFGASTCSFGDICIDSVPGDCGGNVFSEGPNCVIDPPSSNNYYEQECDSSCPDPSGVCDALNWVNTCPGGWDYNFSYRNAVDCCDDSHCLYNDCTPSHECIYGAENSLNGETLDCNLSSTAADWFKDHGDRCGTPSEIATWDINIANGSSTADFISDYNDECSANFGTTVLADCNNQLLCDPGDDYVSTTTQCIER